MNKFLNSFTQKTSKTCLLFALSLLFSSATWAAVNPLDLGDGSQSYFSPEKDKKMGERYFHYIRASNALLSDAVVTNYIENLGQRLARATNNSKLSFHFFVVDDSNINAFTGPGGYIGVNSGLINMVNSQSELAAVLAHEIGHVTQHHIALAMQRAKAMRFPSLVLAAAAVAIGAKNPDVGAGALAATEGGMYQNILNFSRENESEADHAGVRLLYRANFDPEQMPRLFQRMQKIENLYPADIPEYLQTHPMDDKRIADTENLAARYPKKQYPSDPDFPFIHARIRIATGNDLYANKNYFQNKMTSYPNDLSYRYGYALSLLNLRQTQLARTEIDGLLRQAPNNLLFLLAKANQQTIANQLPQAVLTLKQAYKINPHYYPVVFAYAITLVSAHNGNAEPFIAEQIKNYPHQQKLYYLLAKAQANRGENVRSHESLAKYLAMAGADNQALAQFQIAQNLSHGANEEKVHLKEEIKKLQEKMAES
jgi:predicted Zn-dependent protease